MRIKGGVTIRCRPVFTIKWLSVMWVLLGRRRLKSRERIGIGIKGVQWRRQLDKSTGSRDVMAGGWMALGECCPSTEK